MNEFYKLKLEISEKDKEIQTLRAERAVIDPHYRHLQRIVKDLEAKLKRRTDALKPFAEAANELMVFKDPDKVFIWAPQRNFGPETKKITAADLLTAKVALQDGEAP